ncbi:class I SAM-dependent methyltransferase [Butyrivibrio sp. NC3005]|uniref:class I SAM-dependent methyltransferase n=1 Tax=Butyrivibrio sp. NC3005 TaxID=1280685 RepID=UPI0009DBFFE3|nr:class I SAM-dependent methyltransferase [Butyrivibrio sp. NC3005]
MSINLSGEAKIGNVKLNLDHYSGKDLYCDGAVEDQLLDIVKNHTKEEFPQIIEEYASWPVLYHLSEMRSNIVEWIPMNHMEKVLEVGAGCGAITGKLAEKAASVTCVELSQKRSEINAYRNKDCDNITIHIGNFTDIEPDLPNDFDYIFLIGVFEYGQSYIGGDTPYEDFIKMLQKHLSINGRIVIAIENRTGLKYFAGCREDHLGTYFSGIEGYTKESVARTFTRNALISLMKKCGIKNYHFYYPYPDYKLPTMIHSDIYLPGLGELSDCVRNFDNPRMRLFDEKYAYDSLIKDGMYPDFANSFEIIIGNGFPTVFSKFSNDRGDEFKIRTDITLDIMRHTLITKTPMTEKAKVHIKNIRNAYVALKERYEGGELEINECNVNPTTGAAAFPFVEGEPLSALMDRCIMADDMEGFKALFEEYMRRTSYHEDVEVADYDLIFSNILVDKDKWTVIDYEWTYGRQIPAKEIAFRALYCYLEEDPRRRKINVEQFYEMLGIDEKEQERLLEVEAEFQKYVTNNRKSLVEMWNKIGRKVTVPEEMKPDRLTHDHEILDDRIQVYFDYGQGLSEEQSQYVPEKYDADGRVTINLELEDGVRDIRIDPAITTCMMTIESVLWNDVEVFIDQDKLKIYPNGVWLSNHSLIFGTDDPGVTFKFRESKLKRRAINRFSITFTKVKLDRKVAGDIISYQQRPTEEIPQEQSHGIGKIKDILKTI